MQEHFVNATGKSNVENGRGRQMHHHLPKRETSAVMKDDIYAFILCLNVECLGENATAESVILPQNGTRPFAKKQTQGTDVYWRIKFGQFVAQQTIISNESIFATRKHSASQKTTFVNETNIFYQHVDQSSYEYCSNYQRIWL